MKTTFEQAGEIDMRIIFQGDKHYKYYRGTGQLQPHSPIFFFQKS